MTQLAPQALDFARHHLTAFWDSDFFPKAFEFQALWEQWDLVRDHLSTTPIEEFDIVLPRMMAAPKPDGGYRVVHQLDPLNVLAYTAMAHQVSIAVENARPPIPDRVACSYRIALDDAGGSFFGDSNGFGDFAQQSRDLAAHFEYVLTADITDFYNQIYLHRLQNAISSTDATLGAMATDIERFLTRLNDGVSHGVPVGPAASIIMSEAVLLDVDSMVRGRGFQHTRYVDDFRIFSDDISSLRQLQQDLTQYLHSNHRLVLASGKTRPLSTAEFLQTTLDDPEETERREIHGALQQIGPTNGYEFEDDMADDVAVPIQQRADAMRALMDRVCAIDPLDLGLARHVLRRCRRYRIRAIIPQLLARLQHFAPAMNDVVLYLSAVINQRLVDLHHDELLQALTAPNVLDVEWLRYWGANLIVRNRLLLERPAFANYVTEHGDLENQAHAALLLRDVAWVRDHRARIDEMGGWPRRQVLRAGLALAADERRHWYRNLLANNRPGVERWLLPWLINQP